MNKVARVVGIISILVSLVCVYRAIQHSDNIGVNPIFMLLRELFLIMGVLLTFTKV